MPADQTPPVFRRTFRRTVAAVAARTDLAAAAVVGRAVKGPAEIRKDHARGALAHELS